MNASFLVRSCVVLMVCGFMTACASQNSASNPEDFSPKKTVEMEGVQTVNPAGDGWTETTVVKDEVASGDEALFDPEIPSEPSENLVKPLDQATETVEPEKIESKPIPVVSPLTPTKEEPVIEIDPTAETEKHIREAKIDQAPRDQISVIYFFDYSLPVTAQLEKMIMGLREFYGPKVLWVYRPIGNFGSSHLAAAASECAKAQGSWEIFHEGLLNLSGTITEGSIETLVKTSDLDQEAFEVCLKSTRTESLLQAFSEEAEHLNVKEVPAFVVAENVVFSGKYPAALFEQLLKSSLKGRLK